MNKPDAFLELLDSLSKYLAVAITIKITDSGCRKSYQAPFMHNYFTKSLIEKWLENSDWVLYSINMRDVAKENNYYNYITRRK